MSERATPRDMAGEVFEAEIGKVAHGGHCVTRYDGRVVFVRHTLPGERVRVQVTHGREGDRFLLGDAVEVLTPSEHRVVAPCPFSGPGRCGGCDWQHAEVAYQRRLKSAVVVEQLERLAGLHLGVEVEPVAGDHDGLRWRTRVEFAVDADGRPGLRRHHSHDIVAIDDCLIATERVVASGVLGRRWSCSAVAVVDASSEPRAVVAPTGAAGVPDIVEHVDTKGFSADFHLSARGFWQVHPGAAATFVSHVLSELAPLPGERALDLYCGVGLFARALADAVGPAGAVLAVESEARAVRDAKRNLGTRPEIEIRRGKVDRALRPLVRQRITADVVVLDPPRTGAGRAVIRDIAALRPRAIAYVACDPGALARDLAYAARQGYAVRTLRAFDAFPMTHHVECIALLVPNLVPNPVPQEDPT